MDLDLTKRTSLLEQADTDKSLIVDSAYWRIIKYDKGVLFLDAWGQVPPFEEVVDLFSEITSCYDHADESYGSIAKFNRFIQYEISKERETPLNLNHESLTTIPKSQRRDKEGYVYLLKSGDSYKIGKSIDVNKRMKNISPIMPHRVTLIHSFKTDNMDVEESRLHQMFDNKRLLGEWFALNEEDVSYIKGIPKIEEKEPTNVYGRED